MNGHFRDRIEAGQLLAPLLGGYARRDDVVVLAIPRGGVEVGFELACRLHAPLGLLLAREIPVPDLPDIAMGVVAEGDLTRRNEECLRTLGISAARFAAAASHEHGELECQVRKFRPHGAHPELADKIVILAADGAATAHVLLTAIAVVRAQQARSVVLAAPVVSLRVVETLRAAGCETLALLMAEDGCVVREFYGDFSPPSDDEIVALLERANLRRARPKEIPLSP